MKPFLFKVIKEDIVYWRLVFSILGERCAMNILDGDKAHMMYNILKQ